MLGLWYVGGILVWSFILVWWGMWGEGHCFEKERNLVKIINRLFAHVLKIERSGQMIMLVNNLQVGFKKKRYSKQLSGYWRWYCRLFNVRQADAIKSKKSNHKLDLCIFFYKICCPGISGVDFYVLLWTAVVREMISPHSILWGVLQNIVHQTRGCEGKIKWSHVWGQFLDFELNWGIGVQRQLNCCQLVPNWGFIWSLRY